jgi:hypothetical protein
VVLLDFGGWRACELKLEFLARGRASWRLFVAGVSLREGGCELGGVWFVLLRSEV